MKLTAKQRLFADEYIKSGNATQSAIKAGYNVRSAKVIGAQNLSKLNVKSYIDAKMAEIESHKIADAKEVLQYLTRVLRGEEKEEIPDNVNGGTIKRPPLIKDRTVAAREIMKRYPLDDPIVAAQLKKLQAEADTAIWKRDELTGKNDTNDKTVLIDDIGGD
ncbi:terminase small subunit [Lactobacillus phage phiPYB5]|uniref:terminase small subunit n=1 Tax=Lactobacillus phage phiPYB5 TaxID=438780 RepID=UPI0001C0AD84|nr:terminase small subunit [Lactobacillus phage phiPYB5]ADA79892.1 terminase small subunit [Lactobacillus phage phiPYB5]